MNAMAVGAPDARVLWTELDHGLLAHLEAEERYSRTQLLEHLRDRLARAIAA